jgi:hypothetical protein
MMGISLKYYYDSPRFSYRIRKHSAVGSTLIPEAEVSFRIRRRSRIIFAIIGLLLGAVTISIFYAAIRIDIVIADSDFGPASFRLLPWLIALMPLLLIPAAVYMVSYWWTYRITFGTESISREGVPHIIDRRVTIDYADIEQVTRGNRNVIKIVPREGRPLSTNVKELEGGPEPYLAILHERIPDDQFDPDLEAVLFETENRDRWNLALSIILFLVMIIGAGSLFLSEALLKNVAWTRQFELDREQRLRLAAAAPDGSIWMLVEGDQPNSEELMRVAGGEIVERMRLADIPIMEPIFDLRDGVVSLGASMTVDEIGRLWLNLSSNETYSWDGRQWSSARTASDSGLSADELEYGAGAIWASLLGSSGLVEVDPATGSSENYPLEFEFPEVSVEFSPYMINSAHDGGLVSAGNMNPGGLGLLYFASDGEPSLLTFIPKPESIEEWRLQHVAVDAEGQMHVLFQSSDVCADGIRRVRSGSRLVDTEWIWRDLAFEADCSGSANSDSLAVDPWGRTWVETFDSGVHVFESPSHGQFDEPIEPIVTYSHSNSGLPSPSEIQSDGGLMLAVRGFGGELASIDTTQGELPAPLPGPIAWFIGNSYIIYVLIIPIIAIMAWRQNKINFRR